MKPSNKVLLVKHLYMWVKTHRDEGDSLLFFFDFRLCFFLFGDVLNEVHMFFLHPEVYAKLPGHRSWR